MLTSEEDPATWNCFKDEASGLQMNNEFEEKIQRRTLLENSILMADNNQKREREFGSREQQRRAFTTQHSPLSVMTLS